MPTVKSRVHVSGGPLRATLWFRVLTLASVLPWMLACGGEDELPNIADLQVDDVPNKAVPHERLPKASDAFTETACSLKAPGRVTQCGFVEVPEGDGSDRTVRIAVARVFTRAREPRQDPIVYLDGGPGGASLSGVDWLTEVISEMSADRDLIFVDQRGVGLSRPNLQCTERGGPSSDVEHCYDRLSLRSDLDQYNTINNARDIDLVRQAFGYEQWNLLGVSYGTRLGLTIMRDYPEGVRSAVIDSVVPLQADLLARIGLNGFQAFERTFDACAADAECNSAFPGLMETLVSVVTDLSENPKEIGLLVVDGTAFVDVIFGLLYSPFGVARVPQMVHAAGEGDFSVFEQLEPASGGGGSSFGMHLSLHCSEEMPFSSAAEFERFDAEVPEALREQLSADYYLDYCENWPVKSAPESENEPVESDVPTLVMAGYFDPITPPVYAEDAHQFLTNSQYAMLGAESHGASFGECGVALAGAFFDDPSVTLENTCPIALDSFELGEEEPPAGGGEGARKGAPARLKMRTDPLTREEVARILDDVARRRHFLR